jgi:hypothetical protein
METVDVVGYCPADPGKVTLDKSVVAQLLLSPWPARQTSSIE